jgi:hypothetical protein
VRLLVLAVCLYTSTAVLTAHAMHGVCVLLVCAAAYGGAYLVLVQNSILPCLPSKARHGCACLS